jgi:competence protein ComEC
MEPTGSARRFSGTRGRWPAVPAAVSLAAGILAHDHLPPKPDLWLILIAILLAIAFWRVRIGWICSLSLAAAIFLIGLTTAQLQAYFFASDHIAIYTSQSERLADLEVRLIEPPHIVQDDTSLRRIPPKQVAAAEVTSVRAQTGWRPASGRIELTIEPPDESLNAGQTIRAWGFLSRPQAPENPGEFNFAAYDRRQRVMAEFRIRRSSTIEPERDDGPSPLVRLRQSARNLLAEGFPLARALDADFLRLLLLGDSDPRVDRVRDEFDLTGTAYQLSISGLHIAIIGGTVLLLLRLLRVRPVTATVAALAVVLLYAAVALPSETGIRALIMCVAGALGLLAGKTTRGLQLLAVAVIAVLLISPMDIYNAGFQIGAAAVAALILLGPRVVASVSDVWASDDPWRQPPRGIHAFIHNTLHFAGRILLATSVIWLAILPLVAIDFHEVSIWTVPGGVVLLPLTVITLLSAAAKIFLTLMLPHWATAWAAAAAIPSADLRHSVRFLANLPAAGLSLASPSPSAIAAYYAFLLAPLIPWRWRRATIAARFAPIAACMLLFLPISELWAPGVDAQSLRVTFLSIGTGQAALARVPGGKTYFLDCGSATIPDVYRRVIHPYLRQQGISQIDGIVLTGVSYENLCAANEILNDYHVPTLFVTPDFSARATSNYAADDLLRRLDIRGPTTVVLNVGDELMLGGGADLHVLWPALKLSCAGRSVLFTCDAQKSPLPDHRLVQSDVLVGPSHGSADGGTVDLLSAVDPKLIICSSDRDLTQKQLAFDQVAGVRPVYRTGTCGAIDLSINPRGRITVDTFTAAGPAVAPDARAMAMAH